MPDVQLPLRHAPAAAVDRTLLFALRRMAVAGLEDAQAASALMGLFGLGYRRPLVLARALMAELAATARRPILVVPPCCCRMTGDEAAILHAIGDGASDSVDALRAMLGRADCEGAAMIADALGGALRDLGRPLQMVRPRSGGAHW